MNLVTKRKIEIIRVINEILIANNRGPLNVHDFDSLYDMDIDQLMEIELKLDKHLESKPSINTL